MRPSLCWEVGMRSERTDGMQYYDVKRQTEALLAEIKILLSNFEGSLRYLIAVHVGGTADSDEAAIGSALALKINIVNKREKVAGLKI